jgi:hypothetical protein
MMQGSEFPVILSLCAGVTQQAPAEDDGLLALHELFIRMNHHSVHHITIFYAGPQTFM